MKLEWACFMRALSEVNQRCLGFRFEDGAPIRQPADSSRGRGFAMMIMAPNLIWTLAPLDSLCSRAES